MCLTKSERASLWVLEGTLPRVQMGTLETRSIGLEVHSAFSPMQECLRLETLQEAGQGEELVILVVLNVIIIFRLTS